MHIKYQNKVYFHTKGRDLIIFDCNIFTFCYNFLDEIDEQDKKMFSKQQQSDTVAIDERSKKKPWITLVSYVDDLTVGGRRDSKGNFVDAAPSFPGFGRNKQSKAPQECFPYSCYQR